MNYNKSIGISLISLALMIVLMKFQNCAPAPQAVSESQDSEVRIVDDWTDQKVALPDEDVVLADDVILFPVPGFCSIDLRDQEISWQLKAQDQSVILGGESLCDRGGFEVEASRLDSLQCGEDYLIEASAESGHSAQAVLRRRCSADVKDIVHEDPTRGEICAVEQFQEGGENQCYYSCYQGGRMVSEIQMNDCPEFSDSN